MIQKQSFNVIKGMRQDISPSKANPEYIFDARNIRLTARGNDTLLSITNEQGTQECKTQDDNYLIQGKVLGYCVLNNYLVVFNKSIKGSDNIEQITRIYQQNNKWISDVLYSSHTIEEQPNGTVITKSSGNLNFGDTIQTLGIYENDNIQKVYWTDKINQPRVINIVKDLLEFKSVKDVRNSYTNTSFDFIPELLLNESISVKQQLDNKGTFQAGVIQYAFTYYNKYGQESNIFYVTDLYNISHSTRGASPEDIIGTSFNVSISNVDKRFDFIRAYSIHRTSVDATPYVKRVADIPIKNQEDSNTNTRYILYYRFNTINDISISTDDGVSYSSITNYSAYRVNTHPTLDGSSQGAKAEKAPYYVFDSSIFPNLKIALKDGSIITYGQSDQSGVTQSKIFISDTAVNGPGNSDKLIIVPDEHHNMLITSQIGSSTNVSFIDNNSTGESIDPTLLLYVGGEEILAGTISQKDNTLFLGNISLNKYSIPDIIKKELLNYGSEISSDTNSYKYLKLVYRQLLTPLSYGLYYKYYNFLQQGNTCTFKQGEHYRLGVQFQHKNGKWSEPVLINYNYVVDKGSSLGEVSQNNKMIIIKLPVIEFTIPSDIIQKLYKLGFRKVRSLIVNPTINDRLIIAQGMICPTVYRTDSVSGQRTYQSSWFLRPIIHNNSADYIQDNKNIGYGATIEYKHDKSLKSYKVSKSTSELNLMNINRGIEIEGLTGEENFKVSQQIVTFHSPDIEFDSSVQNIDGQSYKFRVNKVIPFESSIGDIDIQTSSPTIGPKATGFYHAVLGVPNSNYEFAGRSLVAGMFYNDWIVDYTGEIFRDYDRQTHQIGYLIHPWQSSGSLNNDINRPSDKGARSAVLKRKVISNLKYSADNISFTPIKDYNNTIINIFNSNEQQLIKIGGNNYLGNVDTLLIAKDYSKAISLGLKSITEGITTDAPSFTNNDNITTMEYLDWRSGEDIKDYYSDLISKDISIRMKYKSTPHAVMKLNEELDKSLPSIGMSYLFMGEIYRDNDTTINDPYFGGRSDQAVKNNQWIPSSTSKSFGNQDLTISFIHGDCYYQRYDCLKTYPYTNEDENSIVEIGSFMVETRVNIEGRYDRNIGLDSNLNITPQNFNLWNSIYSQKDNFFNYRILDQDLYKLNNFPNTITWSKEKSLGETIDTWTNINMTNTIDVDGNLGQVQSIENYNNELYCFQDKGVSKILFNNRVQIPTSDNIPIEISNGYKVQGKVYLSNTIGCQNQRAIKVTPNGIYFSDLYNSGIYLLNGQGLQDISTPRGFTNWVKTCKPTRLHYDTNNGDLYLIGDGYPYDLDSSKDLSYRNCLCFSEKLNEFTSFMDYNNTDFMFNIDDSFYSLNPKFTTDGNISILYKMFEGEYNNFFDDIKPYHISYIANQNPTNDKIFNTLEFRADSLQDNNKLIEDSSTPKSPNICPFNKVTVWNEYQEGTENLSKVYGKPSALKEKFRTWRVNIPRDNVNKRDRIRNPWAYIKLEGYNNTNRMQLHDMQVWYYDNDIWKYQQK